jgi:Tfp pilus assembly protein FimT
MSTADETQPRRERSILYLVIGIAVAILMIFGVIVFRAANGTRDAQAKADELIQAFEDAGATAVPSQDRIVSVLGEDGGAVCANPNHALSRATLNAQLANGATGPGARPVISDRRVLQGQLLIIQIYCPEELEEFQEFVDGLQTDDVASG